MSEQNSQENVQTIPVNASENEPAVDAAEEVHAEEQTVFEPEIVTDEEIAEEAAHSDDAKTDTPDESAQNDAANDESEQINADQPAASSQEDEAPKETDWKDSYIRLAADFDNYRKRTSKEQDDIRRREREKVICAWLEVYDNAERALASMPEKEGPWYEGFSSLIQQMDKCLLTYNIKPSDDMGQKFDPKRHEAIATCPNPAMENNTIMHVERRGFVYENGNVVRVARVIVVKNPS